MNGLNILILVVLIGGMLFMTTRTQKKQRDTRNSMMAKLQPGAGVVTIGRLHGVVESINEAEKTFTLDADGIYLVFDLDAIARVTEAPTKTAEAVVETPAEEASVVESNIVEEAPVEKIIEEKPTEK